MRKVLFGIMALSMAAFAVQTNPGTANTASVPVKVIAEIITAPTGLTITDEAGTVLDELLINHGRIIKGQATSDSVAYKIFNVRRYNKDGAEAVLATAANQKIQVTLDNNTTELKKDGTNQTKKIASDLRLTGGDITTTTIDGALTYTKDLAFTDIDNGDKIHSGRVTSIIAQATLNPTDTNNTLESGIYHNSRERQLTVTILAK